MDDLARLDQFFITDTAKEEMAKYPDHPNHEMFQGGKAVLGCLFHTDGTQPNYGFLAWQDNDNEWHINEEVTNAVNHDLAIKWLQGQAAKAGIVMVQAGEQEGAYPFGPPPSDPQDPDNNAPYPGQYL